MLFVRSIVKIFFVLMFLVSVCVSAYAVEYGEAENSALVAEVALEAEVADATVQELIEAPKEVASEPSMNAKDKADEFLAQRGVHQGWNSDKKVYIAVGESSVDCEDPSYDDSFLIKRSLKAMEATLSARADIIKYIRTDMSAMDKATTPGTDLYEQFNKKLEQQKNKIEAQHRKVMKLLTQAEQAEIEANLGVTTKDRVNAFLEAAIKKLDSEFDAGKLESKNKKDIQKLNSVILKLSKNIQSFRGNLKLWKEQKKKLFPAR